MSRADYLAALHSALDARRDPLDDAAVRDWLAAHPEDLPEFAAMRGALTAVSRLASAPRQRRSLWPMIFPPLAAAAALLLFLHLDRPAEAPSAPAPAGTILTVSLSTTITPAAETMTPAAGPGVLASSVSFTRTPAF